MSVNIRIKHAVKRYGSNTILSDLSLVIKEGEFFTLLGPLPICSFRALQRVWYYD